MNEFQEPAIRRISKGGSIGHVCESLGEPFTITSLGACGARLYRARGPVGGFMVRAIIRVSGSPRPVRWSVDFHGIKFDGEAHNIASAIQWIDDTIRNVGGSK